MEEYDVVVVGAGNAALAAAVSARENGAESVSCSRRRRVRCVAATRIGAAASCASPSTTRARSGRWCPARRSEFENFYAGISALYARGLPRRPDARDERPHRPVLSRLLVDSSKDTVFWMNQTGRIKMEPATTLSAVQQDNSWSGRAAWWCAPPMRASACRAAGSPPRSSSASRSATARAATGAAAGRRAAASTACGCATMTACTMVERRCGRARLRRLRGERADAHAAYRPAGRRGEGARHAAQPGRRAAHGDGDQRHALGPVERLPRHADQRRLGRFRTARADRPLEPAELRLRRHAQPRRPPLRR